MEIFEIKLNNINKGDVISFYTRNSDPQFGSVGSAEQHIKCLGSNNYEVLKSTRSLDPGMIISTDATTIKVYEQVDFFVVRIPGLDREELNKRSLLFRMRPIDKIELNQFPKKINNG